MSDLQAFHGYRSNPEVTRYQGFDVMTIDEAKAFILENEKRVFGLPGQWIQLAIADKLTDMLIGDCAIRFEQADPRIVEVGMTLSQRHQQQGYAKEAGLALLTYLFEAKNIHRVVEIVDAENDAAIAGLKSVGFRQEGHFIENIFFKGQWGSEFQFALLRREWMAMKEKLIK